MEPRKLRVFRLRPPLVDVQLGFDNLPVLLPNAYQDACRLAELLKRPEIEKALGPIIMTHPLSPGGT